MKDNSEKQISSDRGILILIN